MNYPPPYTGFAPPPPAGPEPFGMAKTLGVLSMIFGGIVAFYDLFQIVSAALQWQQLTSLGKTMGASGTAMVDFMRTTLPLTMAQAGVMVLMSLMLIAVGVGLYRQSEAARKGGVVWAGVALAVIGGRALLFEAVYWPKYQAFMTGMMSGLGGAPSLGGLGGTFSAFARGAEYVSLFVLAIYPIVLLALLNTQGFRSRTEQAS